MFVYFHFNKKEKANLQGPNLITPHEGKTKVHQPQSNKGICPKMNQQIKHKELFPRVPTPNKKTKSATHIIQGI